MSQEVYSVDFTIEELRLLSQECERAARYNVGDKRHLFKDLALRLLALTGQTPSLSLGPPEMTT